MTLDREDIHAIAEAVVTLLRTTGDDPVMTQAEYEHLLRTNPREAARKARTHRLIKGA